MNKLFIDDERNPEDVTWITLHPGPYEIVRTAAAFRAYIISNGIPSVISFDNDLGDGGEVYYDCVNWLVEKVLRGDLNIPDDFQYTVHSMNNIAAKQIHDLLEPFINYMRLRKNEKSMHAD